MITFGWVWQTYYELRTAIHNYHRKLCGTETARLASRAFRILSCCRLS